MNVSSKRGEPCVLEGLLDLTWLEAFSSTSESEPGGEAMAEMSAHRLGAAIALSLASFSTTSAGPTAAERLVFSRSDLFGLLVVCEVFLWGGICDLFGSLGETSILLGPPWVGFAASVSFSVSGFPWPPWGCFITLGGP